jgi:hypothetical protein
MHRQTQLERNMEHVKRLIIVIAEPVIPCTVLWE